MTKRRGGWCHELNGCFSWLLRRLGFSVDLVSAQYLQPSTRQYGELFDHMALIVHLGGEDYLVDVGLGSISQPSEPIRWCRVDDGPLK